MPNSPVKRPVRLWRGLLALVLVAVASVVTVKKLDQDSRFCVSCHLHEDLLRDMTARPAVALSSAHFAAATKQPAGHPERCFTCHSGEGVVGWTQVTLLSAWDAARWVAGDRTEPTHMRLPLTDAACLKCHAADVRGSKTAEETDAFHELSDHRTLTVACIACHQVHRRGLARRTWLDDAKVRTQCARCHRDFGGSDAGPGGAGMD
jgi:hypothetical protein